MSLSQVKKLLANQIKLVTNTSKFSSYNIDKSLNNIVGPPKIYDKTDINQNMDKPTNVLNLIKNTPLVKLNKINPYSSNIYTKLEYFQPSGSIKDRIVQQILTKALEEGIIQTGSTIVEASSGNTGSSLALIGTMLGFNIKIQTTYKCSEEKISTMRALGAEVTICPANVSYEDEAENMARNNPSWFTLDQQNNLLNPDAYYHSLGPEIYNSLNGKIDQFIAAGSTGGTISGVAKYLKQMNPNIKIILIDPIGSVFTNWYKHRTLDKPKPFLVEGVGKTLIPGAMNFDIIDDVINVQDKDCFEVCHLLSQFEGIFPGGSGGANVLGALKLAENLENKNIITVIPDSGFKYLSKVYNNEQLKENNLDIDIDNSIQNPANHLIDIKPWGMNPKISDYICRN